MKSLPFHIPEDVCIVGAQTCPHHMNICKVCFSPGFINIKENSFWRTKTWPGSAIGIQTLYGHGLRNQYILEFLNVTFHFVILLSLSFVLPETLLCF